MGSDLGGQACGVCPFRTVLGAGTARDLSRHNTAEQHGLYGCDKIFQR